MFFNNEDLYIIFLIDRMSMVIKMDGVLLINKPAGYTSHDIVNIVRKQLHIKKVGHCGTLDPDATGVLVICVNKATKIIQFLTSESKIYRATLSLGQSTDTYDASGKILEEKDVKAIDKDEVIKVLNEFLGHSKQIPPIYSAIKVKGKKLYEYARAGQAVKIEPRDIEIFKINLIAFDGIHITFDVSCSKGTYIRSLCVDIAKKLGYPGHMSDLIRMQSGVFHLNECITLDDLQNNNYHLLSIDDALKDFKKLTVTDENIVYHGKKIKSHINEQIAICNKEGHILAIYGPDGKGYLKNIRGLW